MSSLSNPRGFLLTGAVLCVSLGGGRAQAYTAGEQQAAAGAASPKAPRVEDEAIAALKEMSTALASARTLRFQVHSFVPMRTATGTWITLVGDGKVMRDGDDKLLVESGGDLFPFRFYFDGKTVIAFAPEQKAYARKAAPGTIDEVLQAAAKRGEVAFVFADLVSSDPYAAMTNGMQGAVVVGLSTIDGVQTRHLAVHGKAIDWEIWIGAKDHLPRMVTLTDVAEARKPTHTVQLSDWAVDEALPDGAFAFRAPPDAVEIPFRDPGERQVAGRRPPAKGAP